jgi:hypothetical protein
MFNMPYMLLGMVLAKDLESKDKLMIGLAAGQSRSLLGPLLLKPHVDEQVNLKKVQIPALKEEADKVPVLERNLQESNQKLFAFQKLKIPADALKTNFLKMKNCKDVAALINDPGLLQDLLDLSKNVEQ